MNLPRLIQMVIALSAAHVQADAPQETVVVVYPVDCEGMRCDRAWTLAVTDRVISPFAKSPSYKPRGHEECVDAQRNPACTGIGRAGMSMPPRWPLGPRPASCRCRS